MIFTTNHMRNIHPDIIYNIYKMKYRLAVRAHNHEIRLNFLSVRQLTDHISTNQIGNRDWFPLHTETNSPIILIGQAFFL